VRDAFRRIESFVLNDGSVIFRCLLATIVNSIFRTESGEKFIDFLSFQVAERIHFQLIAVFVIFVAIVVLLYGLKIFFEIPQTLLFLFFAVIMFVFKLKVFEFIDNNHIL
jgi:hypothetical protein